MTHTSFDAAPKGARPRRWLRRLALSALAGGGMTGVGMVWPLAGGLPGGGVADAFAPKPTLAPPTATPSAPPSSTVSTSATETSSASSTAAAETTSSSSPATTTTQSTSATGTAGHRAGAPTKHTAVSLPQVAAQESQSLTGNGGTAATGATGQSTNSGAGTPANVPSNVAGAPQSVASHAGALAALTSGLTVSAQALDLFYQVPPFLLPVYQAAGIQYGVPWEVLAAINEVETDYGNDLNVSTAGAVGWMQFMPETWLQYGVDALDAGYADPYNPVDAIFAAARYLAAAGAATDVRSAIFSYNHSNEYVESVLLRARLLASYPPATIATLTGLSEGRPPVTGARVVAGSVDLAAFAGSPSSATGNAVLAPTPAAAAKSAGVASKTDKAHAARRASHVAAKPKSPVPPSDQFVTLQGAASEPVVAAQDGRVVALGHSRKLGNYLAIEDAYGDVYSYAGLASLATRYRLATAGSASVPTTTAAAAHTANGAAPKRAATAGSQPPVTLSVSAAKALATELSAPTGEELAGESTSAGKVVMFARPNNPEARIAAARLNARDSHGKLPKGWGALRVGAVVSQGATLGSLAVSGRAHLGVMRFAVRPAGDSSAVNPGPILQNWSQLQHALHPKGAPSGATLVGATADDVFLLSKPELERAVLADPSIELPACGRHEVASGHVDSRVLAALLFLSRNGLSPTVDSLRCARQSFADKAAHASIAAGDAVDISAINGVPVAGHQGAGTITDLAVRTLLTLQGQYAPRSIVSLMHYPGSPTTRAVATHAAYVEVTFTAAGRPGALGTVSSAAHSAGPGATAPSPFTVGSGVTTAGGDSQLSAGQWNSLLARIGGLEQPKVPTKPSSAAIRDPKSTGPKSTGR